MIKIYSIRNLNKDYISYSYIIVNKTNKKGIIIDPAYSINKINEIIKNNNIKILAVLLTHHHHDHSNLANHIAKKYSSIVYMSHNEISYYKCSCTNLTPIKDESRFSIGEINITPIFTPGHTKGSVSYLIGNNLFTGDTLFIEGCGICSTKGGNPELMFKSLKRLKKIIEPNIQVILP